eukprot:symbB.v1.2.028886.t1/scaffold3106.1/size66573/2
MAKRTRLSGISPLARASARSKVEDVEKILKDADSDGDSLLSLEEPCRKIESHEGFLLISMSGFLFAENQRISTSSMSDTDELIPNISESGRVLYIPNGLANLFMKLAMRSRTAGFASRAARIRYALLDVDGVCVMGEEAIPKSAAALGQLRTLVKGHRLITNQSQASCTSVMQKLQRLDFDVRQGEVFSALSAARNHVVQQQLRPLCLLTKGAMEELMGIQRMDEQWDEFQDFETEKPNAVVIGTAPDEMHYKRLTEAMRVLMEKESELIAVNKGRYFRESGEFQLMAGPFVAALEYATGKSATVVGKPSPDFFNAVVRDAAGGQEIPLEQVVMVGDDVRDDIQGAMDVGMRAILVRTGKYRPGDEELCRPAPLAVVDCLADAVTFLQESGLLMEE